MGQAIPVRADYTVGEVRQFAKRAKDGAQARRLLAIAGVLDGEQDAEAITAFKNVWPAPLQVISSSTPDQSASTYPALGQRALAKMEIRASRSS